MQLQRLFVRHLRRQELMPRAHVGLAAALFCRSSVEAHLKPQHKPPHVEVYAEALDELLLMTDKKARQRGLRALLASIPDAEDDARTAVAAAFKARTRAQIIGGRRADGRTHVFCHLHDGLQ